WCHFRGRSAVWAWLLKSRRRVARRVARGTVFAVVVALAVGVVAPRPGVVGLGSRAFPVSWLWSWLAAPGAWSAPSPPPAPVQQSGTAGGLEHTVPAAATRAGKGNGRPRGKGGGELPAYRPHVSGLAPVGSGSDPGRDRFDPRRSRRIASA